MSRGRVEDLNLDRKIEMLNEPSDSEDEFLNGESGMAKPISKPTALPETLFHMPNEHQPKYDSRLTTMQNPTSIQNDYHMYSRVPCGGLHSSTKNTENYQRQPMASLKRSRPSHKDHSRSPDSRQNPVSISSQCSFSIQKVGVAKMKR